MLTFGSLFAGIGGIDLGLERTGRYRCLWQVENEPFCQQILAKHWPDVPRYEDIRTIDFTTVPPVDVLVGGFPCQDLSVAGRKKGIKKNETRSGLWYEFERAICDIKPRGVLVENVQGLLAPHALGIVLRSLAQLGYDAQWGVLSAEDVGAPHLRKRVFICASVADPTSVGVQGLRSSGKQESSTHGPALVPVRQGERSLPTKGDALSRMGGPTHGISQKLDSAWGVGWEENVPRVITGQPHRAKRLRALGNAVVPQCATVVGCYLLGLLGET